MDSAVNHSENLAALEEYLSVELRNYLGSHDNTVSKLVHTPAGVNIDLGGRLLYPEGIDAYIRPQVDAFLERPVRRISFAVSNFLFEEDQFDEAGHFTPRGLDAHKLARQLHDERPDAIAGIFAQSLLKRVDDAVLEWFPDAGAGHLISFGLGLGVHLSLLVSELNIRDLVVVDPYPEFLKHSLSVVDWTSIVSTVRSRGGRIYFLFGNSASELATTVQQVLRGSQYARIDGAYMYSHYAADPLPETISQIQDRGPVLELSKGFYEDELLMLSHTVWNMALEDTHFLDPSKGRMAGIPAAIVLGSGPSLDKSISDVKRLVNEGALLFSAGTGLSVALDAGLEPDLHFEIENDEKIVDGLKPLMGRHDLSKIPIFCSWTVAPVVLDCFGEKIFFFRDSNAGARLFAEPNQPIFHVGPTVANQASRFAAAVGIPAVFLFGVDLGSRDKAVHHSQQSIYSNIDDEFWRQGCGMDDMELQAAGNFGGTVLTSRQFMLTKHAFEGMFRVSPGTKFFNCSDGVALEGADPMPPTMASLSMLKQKPVFDIPSVALPSVRSNVTDRLEELDQALDRWAADMRAVVEESDTDLERLIDLTAPLISLADSGRHHGPMATVHCFFAGSVLSMMQISYAIVRRLPPLERHEVTKFVVNEFSSTIEGAVQRLQMTISELKNSNFARKDDT